MKPATAEMIIDSISVAINQLITLDDAETIGAVLLMIEASAAVRALIEYAEPLELIDDEPLELIKENE